jgi:hypothetical protein
LKPVTRSSLRATLLVGLASGALTVAATVPFLSRYGWDRDELYFLSAAKRPSLGYVDFPPLTAWLAWLLHALAGDTLAVFRLTGLVAALGTIVLVALIARELGGGLSAQAAAALVAATSPYLLGSASIFHPTWLDQLAWVALLYLDLRVLGRPEPRLWPLVGLVAGIGLEVKYTIGALIVGLLVGLLLTPSRRLFATRGPWLAGAVALACLAPNLVWQALHGWPSLDFFGTQRADTSSDTSHLAFVAQGAGLLGAGSVLAAVGLVWLWRRRPELRALAIAPVVATLLFFFEGGRAYYPLPADLFLIGAGMVALESWLGARRWLAPLTIGAIVSLQALALALVLPLTVPVRTTAGMIRAGIYEDTYFGDEIGWPELADQTASAWRRLRPSERADAVILAGNYGEASALEQLGPTRGLPAPVSGHLSWQYWRPKALPQRHALVVGLGDSGLDWLCSSWRVLERIDNRWHLANEERGRTIAACTLRRPLEELWDDGIARNEL